jgi:hypothetical protein
LRLFSVCQICMILISVFELKIKFTILIFVYLIPQDLCLAQCLSINWTTNYQNLFNVYLYVLSRVVLSNVYLLLYFISLYNMLCFLPTLTYDILCLICKYTWLIGLVENCWIPLIVSSLTILFCEYMYSYCLLTPPPPLPGLS